MQFLRRLVRFGFGLQALAMLCGLFVALSTVAALRRAAEDGAAPMPTPRLLIAVALILPLLNTLPAIAWWSLKKARPSARRWTIGTSLVNLVIAAAGIDTWIRLGHMRTWPFYAFCGVNGVLGLFAFWKSEHPRMVPKPSRISGDGTSKTKDFIAQGVSIAILWCAAGWWKTWAIHRHLVVPGLVSFVGEMEFAVLLTNFGHELGHLAAGWASRKKLRSFQVGPFRWAIRGGAWRFDFNLRKFYGGAVAMITPDLKNVRSRKAFSLIGGPVASLVIGSIFIVVTMLAPGRSWEEYWMPCSMLATFSIAAFIVNLIPMKPESLYSDGAQLYQIVTNGPWARVHFAFAMVTASAVSAVRPRDFDVGVLKRAADSVPTGERGLLLRLFACLHYMDADRIPEAVASLEAAEALYEQSKFDRPQDICAEFVFVNAFYKRDLAAASAWSDRIDALGKFEPNCEYWRAQSALHWLRGEPDKANDAWARGHALAEKLPRAGSYEFTRSCFAKLRAALDEPVESMPPRLQSLEALKDVLEPASPPLVGAP